MEMTLLIAMIDWNAREEELIQLGDIDKLQSFYNLRKKVEHVLMGK